jgi:hypothetical protein
MKGAPGVHNSIRMTYSVDVADAFSILSRELSKSERKLLLARILSSSESQAMEPEEGSGPDEPPEWNADHEFARFSLIQRIVLIIRSFFTGMSILDLTEDLLLRRTRVQIEAQAPGLIDFAAGCFSQKLKTELEELKQAFSFLRSVLGGIPRQRDFIAFLAGLKVDSLTERIQAETDPYGIKSVPLLTEERQIRGEMWERFERLIESITPEEKTSVYRDVQRLQMLESLCTVRLDDAIAFFTRQEPGPPLRDLESKLIQLSDLMYAVRFPPSPAAWNAVFLFRAGEALEKAELDLETAMDGFMARMKASLKAVRDFASRVPLTAVLRYIMNDISYVPKGPRGGEEWFVLFKNFWEDRMGDTLHAFSREEEVQGCLTEAMAQFKIRTLPFLENYRKEKFGKQFEARHETSLAMVRGFHQAVFLPSMDRYVKMVAIDGRFFKEENRTAFTDCLESIAQIYGKIGAFEWRLSEAGEPGKLLRGASEHASASEIRLACRDADVEAERIIDGYSKALSLLGRMLFGILFGEAGSPYDSITNLNTLGGKENRSVRKALEDTVRHIDQVNVLLTRIREIEAD